MVSAMHSGGLAPPPFSIPPSVEAVSRPPYPERHDGTALVVGSAWCAPKDFANACALRRQAYVIGVNRSVAYFDCQAMVAIDRGRAQAWKTESREPVVLHGGRLGAKGDAYPWFDYWWPELQSSGTSTWLACKIAAAIGFEEIIVCGAPLIPGPYLDGGDDWSKRTPDQMEAYREPWRKDDWLHPIVRSMSGWTRELLGAP